MLNYNGSEHLTYCLPSILATDYGNLRVILVDNASGDGSPELAKQLAPTCEQLVLDENVGWSGGNNAGIRRALGEGAAYVVLANNDIRVDKRWIREAVRAFEAEPGIGVLGFTLFEPHGSDDGIGRFNHAVARWSTADLDYPRYVGGMALAVRADAFRRVGLIDEEFFAYGEENDFQIRAKRAGYTVARLNLPIWHHGQASFGRIPRRAAELQIRGNLRLLIKHGRVQDLIAAGTRYATRRLCRGTQDTSSAVEARLTFGTPGQRCAILARAITWTLWRLPATLHLRRLEAARARLAGTRYR